MIFAQLSDAAPDWFWNGLLIIGLSAPLVGLLARRFALRRRTHWLPFAIAGGYYLCMGIVWFLLGRNESPGLALTFIGGLFLGGYVGVLTLYD